MTDYLYHHITGEFCAALEPELDAAETQATGKIVWHKRPFSTTIAPPDAKAGERPVWTGKKWMLVADHRGETWHAPGFAIHVDWLGDPASLGLSMTPPDRPTGSAGPELTTIDGDGYPTGTMRAQIDEHATRQAGQVIWHVPPHAAGLPKPGTGDKQIARFDGVAWQIVPDHRGETWYDAEAKPVLIAQPGDPAALGLSAIAPALPREITQVDLHLALDALGWSEVFEAAAAKLPRESQIRLRYAASFREGDPLLAEVISHIAESDGRDVEAVIFNHAKPAIDALPAA